MEFRVSTTRGQHLIGKEVGDCLLEKLIGYGGTSAVFLAQPRNSDQKVAVKVFLPRSTMDTQAQKSFYRRFLREAQAASELEHPHILSIYAYGEHEGLPYIVMPYLPGGTLSEYVKLHGPLSLRVAQSYLQQIADALDYAHECGCVHCDVKPANILMDDNGKVVLSDFGIVRLMQGTSLTAQQSTKSPETLMGTPDYISPEQALGEPLDGRSDIYSLAVTLFYLLAGSPPFKSDSTIAIALMHVHEEPPLLGLQRADVTPQIDQVIHTALAKWPEERYQSAGEFSAAFAEAVSHADNIDRVMLLDRSPRGLLMGKARGNGTLSEPSVSVRLLDKRSALRSRPALLMLALCILVIAATIMAIFLANISDAHTKVAVTPTVPKNDILAGNESAWPSSSNPSSSTPYFFSTDRSYHIHNTYTDQLAVALDENQEYSNFQCSVSMKEEVAGKNPAGDFYGMIIRSSEDQSQYYLFEISAYNGGQNSGGQYIFSRIGSGSGSPYHLLKGGNEPSIKNGLGQSNTLKVIARGNTFTLFINNVKVGQITDTYTPAFTKGEVGLIVEEQNTEVAFSNMTLDTLP